MRLGKQDACAVAADESRGQKNQEDWYGTQQAELRWNKACHGGVEGRISMGVKLKEAGSQNETTARNEMKWKRQSCVDLGVEKFR